MRLVVGAATDVGRVREGNEDGYLVDDTVGLVALADGMGGHLGGEVASATALEALRAAVRAGHPLRDAVQDANAAVFAKSLTDSSLNGMGTTLTAGTLAAGGTLIVAHVGDSRGYLLRDGVLARITTDHSHVQELVDDGQLTDDEAAVHPMRNIVTRAIGMDAAVDVDVYTVELQADDRVLLCSDGLTDMVREEDIAGELRREPDPVVAAHRLVDRANAAGGVDNITVVVVAVTGDDPGDRAVLTATSTDASADARPLDEPAPPFGTEPAPGTVTRDREPREPGRRARLVKSLLWVLAVVIVLAVAVGAVGWYARRSYYVAFDRGRVTVYRGVPGGLLVWDPTVERRTALLRDDLRPADAAAVADEHTFTSLDDANAFVARIRRATGESTPTTTTRPTTTTTTTTTTLPDSATAPAVTEPSTTAPTGP